jgi:hypothetical protein
VTRVLQEAPNLRRALQLSACVHVCMRKAQWCID